METRAYLKGTRLSPQKAGLVADVIRGKNVDEAMSFLEFSKKKASMVIRKLLESAIANADRQNPDADVDNFRIVSGFVDEAPVIKRFRARAMGRASSIKKRSSHITLIIGE